jgi:hypothetical protein
LEADVFFVFSVVPLMLISFTVPLSYQGLGLPEAVLVLYGSLFYEKKLMVIVAGFHFMAFLTGLVLGLVVYLTPDSDDKVIPS